MSDELMKQMEVEKLLAVSPAKLNAMVGREVLRVADLDGARRFRRQGEDAFLKGKEA